MGIRLHKCIGYGLTDVKSENYLLADDRFYEFGAAKIYEDEEFFQEPEEIWTPENFIKYLKNNISWPWLYTNSIRRKKQWRMSDMIIYNAEYGMENVFLVIPPNHTDWMRYDDIIDYTEVSGVAKNTVKILQQGIWPYSGLHQNQYGERLNPMLSCEWWRAYNYILEIKESANITETEINKIKKTMDVLKKISQKLGFKDFEDAEKNISPLVPDIVRAFCEWTNIFTDPATINQLRPILYVYWS